MGDIVLSRKREDQDTGRDLADAFKAKGWSVWWDRDLREGEHFDDVIEDVIRN
jgi:TIR domain-containing protein